MTFMMDKWSNRPHAAIKLVIESYRYSVNWSNCHVIHARIIVSILSVQQHVHNMFRSAISYLCFAGAVPWTARTLSAVVPTSNQTTTKSFPRPSQVRIPMTNWEKKKKQNKKKRSKNNKFEIRIRKNRQSGKERENLNNYIITTKGKWATCQL